MTEKAARDSRALIAFWDQALALSEEDREQARKAGRDGWKELAPAEKLFRAAASLGARNKVLDYGCGSAWAGIIAARSGCPDVTAADPAEGAVRAARFYASLFGAEDRLHPLRVEADWLHIVPDAAYDGFFCSNVLDVVPPETAGDILRQAARIVTEDAGVIIGMNYYLSPEAAAQRGTPLEDGCLLYLNGVLRLVSRTDEAWEALFSPFFTVEKLEHFAWPGEQTEKRRLFYLKKKKKGGACAPP